jgi:hypothetical protein
MISPLFFCTRHRHRTELMAFLDDCSLFAHGDDMRVSASPTATS